MGDVILLYVYSLKPLFFMKNCLIFLFFSLIALLANAQTAEQLLIRGKLLGANESIYLQTDKSSYLPGETVWFKAYAFAGNEPISDKTILYVNLVGPGNRLIENKRLLSKNGAASSYFVLSPNDSSNYYTLQAYTSGMMTLDSSVVYSKTIYLRNDCNQYEILIDKQPSLEVFAEGGSVLEDMPCTYAFRINGINNSNEIYSGEITDASGTVIEPINTTFNGLGKFEFTPEAGKSYTVSVTLDGKKLFAPIPALQSPYKTLLNIYPVKDGVVYRIRSNQPGKFHFIAETNYDIKYKAMIDLDGQNGFAKFLPDNLLGPGVNHFILMDDNNQIVSQRLYYNVKESVSDIPSVNVADTLTDKGELVIHLPDLKTGNYSLAITNADNTEKSSKDNITAGFRISSLNNVLQELKTIPENVTDSLRRLFYDLLMLTHSSVRNDLLNLKKIFTKPVPDDGEATRTLGILTDAESKRVLKEKDLTIFIKQGDTLKGVVVTASDINGMVKLPSMTLEDTATVYFRQPVKEYPKYMLKIVPIAGKAYIKPEDDITIKPCRMADKVNDEITNITAWASENEKLMQGVTVTGIRKSPTQLVEEKYVSPWFSSLSNERGSFDFINDYTNMGSGTVLDFLKNRVMISGSGDVSGANLILNENVVDQGIMNGVNLSDVAIIKVMGPNYIPPVSPYIPGAPSVIVFTKKGEDNVNGTLGVFKMKFTGFATDKPYFNPVFDKSVLANNKRSTLYWASTVKPGKSKTINCLLLNKKAKNLRIILEGIDEKGNPVYINKEVSIKN